MSSLDVSRLDIAAGRLQAFDVDVIIRLFRFHVAGVEVTQAIQYYHASEHLTDPADRGADNGVTLVASKPAWVRVYVRSGLYGGSIAGVTGTLEVRRRHFAFAYLPVTTLSPEPPGTVTSQPNPAYASERGTLSSSLNFIIPADVMCGHLKLIATLTTPGGASDTYELLIDATLRQTLRLRGIMVGYNGPSSTAAGAPNLTIAAPTVADLQTTSGWALRAFPVQSTAQYSSGGTITLTVPLSDAPSCAGCCTPNWVTLNSQVAAQVTADGNNPNVLYYGLIASGVPMGPIIGCESSGVSAGGVGNGVTMAHELGHHCGFPHAPCGNVGTPDSTYPAYEPYDPANTPQASIGEYGLDISNGNVMSPATFKDMMSYCGPKWISLHNYGKLLNNARLDPVRACMDYPWWRDYVLYDPQLIPERWLPDPPPDPWKYLRDVDPVPLVSIIGVLHSERELEVTSVMRLDTRPAPIGGRRTGMSAMLLDERGEVIARAPVHELRSQADGCGCGCHGEGDESGRFPAIVQALVPDAGKGSALVIRSGEEELWARKATERPPRVRSFAARPVRDAIQLSWEVEAESGEAEVWVQWSGGRERAEWRALATGLTGGKAEVPISLLPPGSCSLRLLAGDGFHTSVSKQVRLRVPDRGPDVAILTPRDGETLVAGASMRLHGAATDPRASEETPPASWLIDKKEAAKGLDAVVTAPPAGRHTLELAVGSGRGRARAAIRFVTVDIEREAQRHEQHPG
jgi:hypothetical protein